VTRNPSLNADARGQGFASAAVAGRFFR